MHLESGDPEQAASAADLEMVAGCVSVLAGMKNLTFFIPDCRAIAGRVAARFAPETFSLLLAKDAPGPCPIIEEANAELDRMAAFHVVLIFEAVGKTAPMSSETVADLVQEILSMFPPRKPGDPVNQWPDPAVWEQMAASRFGVATPGEQATFGGSVVTHAGRC